MYVPLLLNSRFERGCKGSTSGKFPCWLLSKASIQLMKNMMLYLISSVWIGFFVVFLHRNNCRREWDTKTQYLLSLPLSPPTLSFIIFKPWGKSAKSFLHTTSLVVYLMGSFKMHFCDDLPWSLR